MDRGSAGIGLGQYAALQVISEREGLIVGVGLAEEIATKIVAICPVPHIGVAHRCFAAKEIVGQRSDVIQVVRHAHERISGVVGVARHVRLAAVDLLDTSEASVDVQEAALDVASRIRHGHHPGRVRRSHAGSIGVERLCLAAASVIGELRDRRGFCREVRRGLRRDQPARIIARLTLDRLAARTLRATEIGAPESIEVVVAPDEVGRTVDRGSIDENPLRGRVTEVEIEPAHGTVQRPEVHRPSGVCQTAERVVRICGGLIVRVCLASPQAPACVEAESRPVTETGGDTGWIRLGALVDGGSRAAASIRGRRAVAVRVVGRRDN